MIQAATEREKGDLLVSEGDAAHLVLRCAVLGDEAHLVFRCAVLGQFQTWRLRLLIDAAHLTL